MISRIGKMLREATGFERFSDAQALRARAVTLFVDDRTDPFLARSAVALTLRCFAGKTNVCRADGKGVPRALAAEVEEEAAEYGDVERLSLDSRQDGELSLGLGCRVGNIFVDACGWSVSVNQLGATYARAAAPCAAFAAAAGVAKLFAALIGRDQSVLHEAWTAPMLDFSTDAYDPPLEADVGRIILIGAGAIGSGLAHVTRGSAWRGEIIVVDSQRYDEPNHETTLLISRKMALRQAPKAATLASLLRSSGLSVDSREEHVDARHSLLSERADVLVCAVDNVELRRSLDAAAANVVLNAGVGGSALDAGHVLWTRHGKDEPPLSSHYRMRTSSAGAPGSSDGPRDVVTDECSRVAYANVSLAAPFMGLAAGALLAASLFQHASAMAAPTNYLKVDLLGLQSRATRQSLRRGSA